MTTVRSYTDNELLGKVEEIGGVIPNKGKNFLIIGVQSEEDTFDRFDDKFYVYDGRDNVLNGTGTTNPGRRNLQEFNDEKIIGAPIWKTDVWYQDLFKRGFHVGGSGNKMRALRQVKEIYFYRDSNRNKESEELGKKFHDIINVNMHGVSYSSKSIIRNKIGYWSAGCQVWNNMDQYRKMIKMTWERDRFVDYALLKEF